VKPEGFRNERMTVETRVSKRSAAIAKYSLAIAGHRTSISLEQAFWDGLRGLAAERGMSIAALVAEIDADRGVANLSSAIRVFVLEAATASRNSPDALTVSIGSSAG
jgi:predicted DNA-binding ribbon-helix-helix protein